MDKNSKATNNTYSFFLSVLSDYLHQRTTELPNATIKWDTIYSFARAHQVEGIVYYQCRRPRLVQAYSATLYYYTNRAETLSTLLQRLQDEKIEHFVIKGASVAALYPVPALRTMGDTDLVVRAEDRKRTGEIMQSLGFHNKSRSDDREWVYYKDDMEFELHDRLVYTEDVNLDKHVAFFNDCWKYVHNGSLDRSFHFLFLVLHLRKHLMNAGVGFRQFMDIAVMMQETIDWTWVAEKLSELELLEFCKNVLALIEKWFHIPVPVLSLKKEIDDSFSQAALETVFKNGVFGFDNEENKANKAINANLAGKSGIRVMLQKLFPSYQTLCAIPYYSFLKGKPWLLLFVWQYRIAKTIWQGKTKKRMLFLTDSFVDQQTIQKREALYEQWGL